jgi:hypothetical protein
MNNPYYITPLVQKSLIHQTNKATCRRKQELHALRLLESKSDYLSLYNSALRYTFLILLQSGYDINKGKVHPAFREFCIECLSLDRSLIAGIIKERHTMKYSNQSVCVKRYTILSMVHKGLKNKFMECAGQSI